MNQAGDLEISSHVASFSVQVQAALASHVTVADRVFSASSIYGLCREWQKRRARGRAMTDSSPTYLRRVFCEGTWQKFASLELAGVCESPSCMQSDQHS